MKSQIERAIEKVTDGSIETSVLVKFFKSHNEIKINWGQTKGLWQKIVKIYKDNISKEDVLWRVHQPDIYTNLLINEMRFAFIENDEIKGLTQFVDIIILPPIPNCDFVFFVPCSYAACVWINNFSCGYSPAKWCLGQVTDKDSLIPFHKARNHKVHELYIVGINKYQYYNQNKDFGKLLLEFTSASTLENNTKQVDYDKCKCNGYPIQVFAATNDFVQIFNESHLAEQLSHFAYLCYKNKIPFYEFVNWNENIFTNFNSFAEKPLLPIKVADLNGKLLI